MGVALQGVAAGVRWIARSAARVRCRHVMRSGAFLDRGSPPQATSELRPTAGRNSSGNPPPAPGRNRPRGAGVGISTTLDPLTATVSPALSGRCLLHRLEVDERRLVIERRLKQIHLRLQQVALRLRDEERRRESDLVAPLFGVKALLRQLSMKSPAASLSESAS
jgi:hypothetical protein